MKRTTLLLIMLLGGLFGANGQFDLSRVSEWTTVNATMQYKLSYVYTDCNIPSEGLYAEYVLLRFENTSKEKLEISWYNDTYYDGKCTNCDHSKRDTKRTIVLAPGEVAQGKCAIGLNIGLRVHSKWTQMSGYPELETLKVTDVQVKPVVGNE